MYKQIRRKFLRWKRQRNNQNIGMRYVAIFLVVAILFGMGVQQIIASEPVTWTEKSNTIGTLSGAEPEVSKPSNVNPNGEIANAVTAEADETKGVEEKEEATAEAVVEEPEVEKVYYEGRFELPINGASGWAPSKLERKEKPNGNTMDILTPGTSFTIMEEEGDWFKVRTADGKEGYVLSYQTFVNLPDIIPSIIYEDTNSVESLFRSSGIELDNITGKALYNVFNWNERLQKKQFDMPVMYEMTFKIMEAQKAARAEGYSLKIYETFRPSDVQISVSEALKALKDSNPTVEEGLNTKIWSLSWFIATKVSNHQRGYAMDVSLVKVIDETEMTAGFTYKVVSQYEELEMPTPMHELSALAVRYQSPYSESFASTMNDNAKLLHKFCTEAGLSPLKSEWWHFNDETITSSSDGKYLLEPNCSIVPNV